MELKLQQLTELVAEFLQTHDDGPVVAGEVLQAMLQEQLKPYIGAE